MRFVLAMVLAGLVASPLSVRAQAGEEGTTTQQNLEEPESSPAPGTEVPDIDILSQRAIEHYEIQSAQTQRRRRRGGTGRKVGIAVGVIVGATLVGFAIWLPVAVSNSFD
jgi:hypothetical protein